MDHTDYINKLDLDQLRDLKILLNHKLSGLFNKNELSSYTYTKEKFLEESLSKQVSNELWDDLSKTPNKQHKPTARYMWFSNSKVKYKFNGHPTLEPRAFKKESCLTNVLNIVNECITPDNKLDSCLAAFYETGEVSVPPHADDEDDIDQSMPIVNISIGATRILKMSAKKSSEYTGEAQFQLQDGTLHVMESGCQQAFVHSVPPQLCQDGKRICLSFRKAKPSPLNANRPHPLMLLRPMSSTPSSNYVHHAASPEDQATIILGTSVTANTVIRSPGHIINLSKSGATIPDLAENIIQWRLSYNYNYRARCLHYFNIVKTVDQLNLFS